MKAVSNFHRYRSLLVSFSLIVLALASSIAVSAGSEKDPLENPVVAARRPGQAPLQVAKISSKKGIFNVCNPTIQLITEFTNIAALAPQASLCINGALAVADPNYNRVLMSSTGTGVGTGVVGNCSLSGSGTAVEYDVYSFNLTGCAAFPTAVDVSLCGPAGCVAPGALDSAITIYRAVAAGDALTANGGLPAVFNPASACTNAVAANDDSGSTPTSPGGSTCSQTGSCLAQCGAPASTANSELRRNLGSGRFTVVVAGFGNGTVGSYNLYVNAPAAGCAVALAPTAAGVSLAGRVGTRAGRGIRDAVVSVVGGDYSTPISVRTDSLGNYSFRDLPAGKSYVVSVTANRYTFANSSRVINLTDNVMGVGFTAVQ